MKFIIELTEDQIGIILGGLSSEIQHHYNRKMDAKDRGELKGDAMNQKTKGLPHFSTWLSEDIRMGIQEGVLDEKEVHDYFQSRKSDDQEATMQKEIEAYEGELKALRWHRAVQVMEKIAFTWHKLECGQCGVNVDLLQRNDGKTMCRQCYNDHFEESEE